ncbi:GlxA family transcriptional regulator [Yinghuangia seranimata]|uniref:GlxA family transcriptional regulator n=1 Tax=Yinghuangia seranimata TaxID=408067 RepID=UPI00248C9E03|nr:GlxA family transcriptional regulator [Yinghuangia seranimata]MDI2126546.1 GlxA family transcriptional regulator [Yinghuangia seranimata]
MARLVPHVEPHVEPDAESSVPVAAATDDPPVPVAAPDDPPARRVVLVGYDGAALLDIACVVETFDAANVLGASPRYAVELVAVGARPVACTSGFTLAAHTPLEAVTGRIDTLIVTGGHGHEEAAADARVVRHVQRLAPACRRVASVCTGATVLAATGLLDGRRVTTHWAYAAGLARRHPAVTVDPAPLYVKDGDVYTSAGVTSALDLTLAFVEEDHGPDMARMVARGLVTYLQRPGNQAQVSMFLSGPPPEHPLVRRLAAHIAERPSADLSPAALARAAGVSSRHLSRLFETQLGTTPARYVRSVRTETAAHLLSSTGLPLGAVARRCGFGSTETMRQAFLDNYGVVPSGYRRMHRVRRPIAASHPAG